MPTLCGDCGIYVYDIGKHRQQFHQSTIGRHSIIKSNRKKAENISSWDNNNNCVFCKEDHESRENHETGKLRNWLRCLQCGGKVFENRQKLLCHSRFHHKYYKCLHCRKLFSDRVPILRHVQRYKTIFVNLVKPNPLKPSMVIAA